MDKFEFAQRFQADKAKYYRITYSYVKNEHDALDVMGEASYKALRSLKALKTPEYFSSWMTRIVINCALDLLRQNSRVTFLDDALPPQSEPPDEAALPPEDSLALEPAPTPPGELVRA